MESVSNLHQFGCLKAITVSLLKQDRPFCITILSSILMIGRLTPIYYTLRCMSTVTLHCRAHYLIFGGSFSGLKIRPWGHTYMMSAGGGGALRVLTNLGQGLAGSKETKYIAAVLYGPQGFQKCEFYQILVGAKFYNKSAGMLGCYGVKFRSQ